MAAAKYDIITEENATVSLSMVYKDSAGTPIDISSGGVPVFSITDNANDIVADTVNATFDTDGTDGAFSLSINWATIDGWGFPNGKYTITIGSGDTILYGKFQVKALRY
jgi:hypothetical protein